MGGIGAETDLVEFSFESEVPQGGLPPAVLTRLARQSWSHNTRMGLTGELAYRNGRFTVAIEGACAVVQPLAARILGDRRHALIRITSFQPLAARRHTEWALSGFDLDTPAFGKVDHTAANLLVLPLSERRGRIAQPRLTAEARTV
jgi:Sensors of blue-light using FAD